MKNLIRRLVLLASLLLLAPGSARAFYMVESSAGDTYLDLGLHLRLSGLDMRLPDMRPLISEREMMLSQVSGRLVAGLNRADRVCDLCLCG